jgi:site-specific DNA recombinase
VFHQRNREVRDVDTDPSPPEPFCDGDRGPATAGRFVVTILAALAQAEREVIGERTKAAMSHMKANGLLVGAVPFGFDLAADARTLAPNPAEQTIVAEVRAAAAAGESFSAIARDLNARGIRTKKGRKWSHVQVGNLIAA